MINVLATTSKTQFAPQLLHEVFQKCETQKNENLAFLSTKISLTVFEEITGKKEEHLVYDFKEKLENGNYVNASISLPLASLLFIDLPNKSRYRKDSLDIQHIRKMIKPLNYAYNVKDFYIDNFESVSCNLMGRDQLWKTNISNAKLYEDWKYRQMEYKMALLFYMSKKYDLNFHIGMTWFGNEQKPIDISFMDYGNIPDMVDEIEYIKTTENNV